MLAATFRNVMKAARDIGVIDEVPDTPRRRQKDNPRPFFRFHPLVPTSARNPSEGGLRKFSLFELPSDRRYRGTIAIKHARQGLTKL